MHRGCIAIGDMQCDGCSRVIKHPEQYLAVVEKEGVEAEEGETKHYCVDCSLAKGYARYKQERGERILSFFPD